MVAPKVTVIIPTFNRAGYLGEAIDSVLRQTLADFELILVDDGSTDDTLELVSANTDPRFRLLRRSHAGISATLNAALCNARGRYIARLDSDDAWSPDMLATLVPVLDTRPEVGVVYAKGRIMDAAGRLRDRTQGMPERFPGDSLRSLLYDDCTCNVALLARRACFDRAGLYDETLPANEDWDMWLRVARHYRFAFVDEVLVHIRWHDGNLTGPTSAHFEEVLATRTAPLDKLFRQPDLPPAVRAMRPIAYTNVHLFRGQRWLQIRSVRKAAGEFGRALRVSDRRLLTAVRIVWFAFVVPLLQRSAVGRRTITAIADLRRRNRRG